MAINQFLGEFINRVGLKDADFTFPDISALTLTQAADRLRRSFYRATQAVEPDLPELHEIKDLQIDGGQGPLKARFYCPLGAGVGSGPLILFFHGGGFVVGNLESHDIMCRRLAHGARARLLAVDYRLAPEHAFPDAHDDALAALEWVKRNASKLNIDADRVAVAGDSAGGNLSAFLCQEMIRQKKTPPAFQLLIYPLLQFVDIRSKKMPINESGFFLSRNLYEYFRDAYVPNETVRMDKRVSPLFADTDDFKGLPPAHIITCGWDPLRDEGIAYADKLSHLGIVVTTKDYPSYVHGFMNMTAGSSQIRQAVHDAGVEVGRALGSRSD